MKQKLTPVIGLEVHCELRTNTKLFCGCPADHFGKKPNTQTCPVCLGLPGELPVTNRKAVEWTLMLGLALGSKLNKEPKFDRKHYFYPDLPMGFQISQYDEPFCIGGVVETSFGKVDLTRVHLEIDTGKLQHSTLEGENVSLIDFNRSGVALMEIVTEPVIKSGEQAKEYAKNLQQIIRYLGISDCDMEKGSMRLEANISLGLGLGYKVEVKNLNSFKFLEKAINYEIARQTKLLEKGETPAQETRGWNEAKQITYSQRYKETADDYRYMPDPDLPPFEFTEEYFDGLKKNLPELPAARKLRFENTYSIPSNYSDIMTYDKKESDFYDILLSKAKESDLSPKTVADLVINKGIKLDSAEMVLNEVKNMLNKSYSSQDAVEAACEKVISTEKKAVEDYKSGKTQVIGFLIGMVQKELSGSGKASDISKTLLNKLK